MFDHIKLFAFDLDGTLYVGESAMAGAVELVRYLRDKYQVVFFTNNSSKTLVQVHDKLNRLGIECGLKEVYSSSSATAEFLREKEIDNLYVVGTPDFRAEVESKGSTVIDNDSAENLVVGLDPEFNYGKIAIGLSVLSRGGWFVACNEDRAFPAGENSLLPGCGAMVAAISSAAGREPDFVVGKPNTYILSKISEDFGVSNQEIVVVGDSYDSDIMMAMNYKCKGILIGNNGVANEDVAAVEDLWKLEHYVRRES